MIDTLNEEDINQLEIIEFKIKCLYVLKRYSECLDLINILNEEEIKMFWFGLGKAKMSEATKLVLRLLLITAQRKGEVSQAEWSEIDLKERWWTIPKERSKNERIHRVPLSPMAIEIFRQAKNKPKDYTICLSLCGRGEKDLDTIQEHIGKDFE